MLLHPTNPAGRQRQSFSLGITCGPLHWGRRQTHLCYYIAAVVLLQNTLMMYNFARRVSVSVVETTSNWTLKQSTATANLQVPSRNQATSSRRSIIHVLDVKSPSSLDAASFDELASEMAPKNERMYYRKRTTKVNTYNHRVLLVPTRLCDTSTVMVILVHSGTRNIAQRDAIRETWGDAVLTGRWPNEQRSESCAGLRLSFVLGLSSDEAVNRAVREEYAHHNDIVQGDFIDHYHNMTLKSLLDLKVVDERCPGRMSRMRILQNHDFKIFTTCAQAASRCCFGRRLSVCLCACLSA